MMGSRVRSLMFTWGSRACVAAAVTAVTPSPAHAWEAVTHAGLAEQAATEGDLHAHLMALGFARGLFEPLTIPPADARGLFDALARYNPSDGFVPDGSGAQPALAWLAAGAALADAHAEHHFFDVATGAGWVAPAAWAGLSARVAQHGLGQIAKRGQPADAWLFAADNPLGLAGFYDQYAKALTAATPAERERHMAGALVAAGALLHVLADLGHPAHVRGDAEALGEPVGPGASDRGSRYARLVALAFGRLGLPAAGRVVTRNKVRDYLVGESTPAANQFGLANWTARTFFSSNTLPAASRITAADQAPRLARPMPMLPARLNLMAASDDDGATLENGAEVCLARYAVRAGELSFTLDDACLLEQAAFALPEIAAFEAGLLTHLFHSRLRLTVDGASLRAQTARGLGAGELALYAEDARGVRTMVARHAVPAAEVGANVPVPAAPSAGLPAPVRWILVFRGVDATGEPTVAVGSTPAPATAAPAATVAPAGLGLPAGNP